MTCNYETLSIINNINNTLIINANKNTSNLITKNEISIIFNESSNTYVINVKDIEDLYSIIKEEIIFEKIKKLADNVFIYQSKITDDVMDDMCNVKFSILDNLKTNYKGNYFLNLAIEEKSISKIHYNNGIGLSHIREIYYVMSYSIYDGLKLIASEFIVSESISDLLSKISNIILGQVEWNNLKKEKIKYSKEYTLIFKNKAAGILFHECIGHFLEADHFYNSPIRLLKDKRLFLDGITIYENYSNLRKVDDENSFVYDSLVLLNNGVIKNVLSNKHLSLKHNIKATGNAITENTQIAPKIRMTNMFVKPGSVDINTKIKEISKGIYIEEISLGEVDVYSGSFSILVSKAYKLINGKVLNPVDEFTLSFNIRNLAQFNIYVCNDILSQSNLCGKMGAVVKVNYSSPSIIINTSSGKV